VFPHSRRGEGSLTKDGARQSLETTGDARRVARRRTVRLALVQTEIRHGTQADEPQGPLRARWVEGAADPADVLRRT